MGVYRDAMNQPNRREIWRIHAGLALAQSVCLPAFIIEISRALGGNTLSWVYVIEWPILGGYAIYMWRRLLADARGETRTSPSQKALDVDETKLAEWNRYLDSVHRRDSGTE